MQNPGMLPLQKLKSHPNTAPEGHTRSKATATHTPAHSPPEADEAADVTQPRGVGVRDESDKMVNRPFGPQWENSE